MKLEPKKILTASLVAGSVMWGASAVAHTEPYKEVRPAKQNNDVTLHTFDLEPTMQLRHHYWDGKLQSVEFENKGKQPLKVKMMDQPQIVHMGKTINLPVPQTKHVALHVEPHDEFTAMKKPMTNGFKRSYLFEYPVDKK